MKFEDMINTIQLGDCYELIKNIPDHSIDLVYIDVPYQHTQINGYYGGGGSFGIDSRKYQRTLRDKELMSGINMSILDDICRVMKHIYIYIWCSKEQIPKFINYFLNKKCLYEIMVWCKSNPTPTCNNKYLSDIEYCLMFREKGTIIGGSYETKSKFYISGTNVSDKELFLHPTIKPLELVKNHIINSTKEGDIVLDCFCGSGTTCLACKELGRNYIGMEIDKEYHKIAVDRLNGITAQGQTSIFTNFDKLGSD